MCDRVHLWTLKYSCMVDSICIENLMKILILLVFCMLSTFGQWYICGQIFPWTLFHACGMLHCWHSYEVLFHSSCQHFFHQFKIFLHIYNASPPHFTFWTLFFFNFLQPCLQFFHQPLKNNPSHILLNFCMISNTTIYPIIFLKHFIMFT